jgi:hypothetical protein
VNGACSIVLTLCSKDRKSLRMYAAGGEHGHKLHTHLVIELSGTLSQQQPRQFESLISRSEPLFAGMFASITIYNPMTRSIEVDQSLAASTRELKPSRRKSDAP